MPERIFVAVAWPYANGSLHMGHIAGAYLAPDIFARYHRAVGNHVLMVSGTDQHGTPITVRADQEGRSPQDVVNQFHPEFLTYWDRLGISFDLYTSTGTANHAETVHDIFLTLYERGHIYKGTMSLPYCHVDKRFLPDRYLIGICPVCGYNEARGDQCDNCGSTLNAVDLIEPRCRLCGTPPEFLETEHFFLRLSAFNEALKEWASRQTHWRRPVLAWTLGMLNEGLQDRAITRDIDWGVTIPLPGYESKRIYVWFEAVIGYLSAAKEWAQRQGQPDAWEPFWKDPAARSYYFVGKDNIPFHTIIWPAMLMGYGGLNLPYDVPANQYVTFGGMKASKSRGWAPWVPEFLDRYDPDPLRYYLSVVMPETSDTEFSLADFYRRNNDELVATWGNLVNRVLSFTVRNFQGRVPDPGELDGRSKDLLRRIEPTLTDVGGHIAACRFRAGIAAAMGLAQEANRYLDEQAPWKTIQEDRAAAARTVYTAVQVINNLKTALYPYLPFTTNRLHGYLGWDGTVQDQGWRVTRVEPGTALRQPEPLYKKLDPGALEEEEARLSS
ncbi:MAG TPA: methionine--tRNA ligase [Dehalococcoidia bacterium]